MNRRSAKSKKPNIVNPMGGIAALPKAQEWLRADRDARAIFSMVTEERGSLSELRALVRRDSILQLIFNCIDLTKSSRARVSALKSRQLATATRQASLQALHTWLDTNIHRYKGKLSRCAMDAIKVPGVNKSEGWVRKEISAYRSARREVPDLGDS